MTQLSQKQYTAQILSRLNKRLCLHLPGARRGKNITHLHQFRTTIRRLRNFFWVFKGILPQRSLQKWKKNLKSVAKITNEARDLDVKIDFLKKSGAGRKKFTVLLKEKRRTLQENVKSTLLHLEKTGILKDMEKVIRIYEKDKKKDSQKLNALARNKIARRLKAFMASSHSISYPENAEELHAMRIAAKNLRYTLEIFQGLFGTAVDEYILPLQIIQNHLGAMHDFDVWIKSCETLFPKKGKSTARDRSVEDFIKKCRSLSRQNYRKFIKAWSSLQENDFVSRLSEVIRQEK